MQLAVFAKLQRVHHDGPIHSPSHVGEVIRDEPVQLLEDGAIEVFAVNDDVTDVEERGKALSVPAGIEEPYPGASRIERSTSTMRS